MSEVFRGARYTLGGLIVLTLWSIGAVQFVEWKLEMQANHQTVEEIATDDALLRFGPGANASDAAVERYMDMVISEKLKE